jgi:hypothetical protein
MPSSVLLYISQILAWADAFHQRVGHWPIGRSGRVPERPELNWRGVDSALRLGLRGLPGGSSLPQLLAEFRGVRNRSRLPRLTVKQIVGWADAHYQRHHHWPTSTSGAIPEIAGETWRSIDDALRLGLRRLAGGSSLARVLAAERRVRNVRNLPCLTRQQVLAWADAHHRRTGAWPIARSGPIAGTAGETWSGVEAALRAGRRGFPGGSSLARLLGRYRRARNHMYPPLLTRARVLRWARAHYRRTGKWPRHNSGPVAGEPGETWATVNRALSQGKRGLRGGQSLYRFLRAHKQALKALNTQPHRTSGRELAVASSVA